MSNSKLQQRYQQERSKGFTMGYYCAVATLLRMEGCVGTQINELFQAGGGINDGVDDDDMKLFAEHGLINWSNDTD